METFRLRFSFLRNDHELIKDKLRPKLYFTVFQKSEKLSCIYINFKFQNKISKGYRGANFKFISYLEVEIFGGRECTPPLHPVRIPFAL